MLLLAAAAALLLIPNSVSGQGCPSKAGYVTLPNTTWVGTASAVGGQLSPAQAEALCNATSDCVAWNSYGYYLNGRIQYFSAYNGLCVYVKAGAWGNGVCSCQTTYTVSGQQYTGCTEVSSAGKPWCVPTSSCSKPDTGGFPASPAIMCTSGPGLSRPSSPPPSPQQPSPSPLFIPSPSPPRPSPLLRPPSVPLLVNGANITLLALVFVPSPNASAPSTFRAFNLSAGGGLGYAAARVNRTNAVSVLTVSVCLPGWSDTAAAFACQGAGFRTGWAVATDGSPGAYPNVNRTQEANILTDVVCPSNAASLAACTAVLRTGAQGMCGSMSAVYCSDRFRPPSPPPPPPTPPRPRPPMPRRPSSAPPVSRRQPPPSRSGRPRGHLSRRRPPPAPLRPRPLPAECTNFREAVSASVSNPAQYETDRPHGSIWFERGPAPGSSLRNGVVQVSWCGFKGSISMTPTNYVQADFGQQLGCPGNNCEVDDFNELASDIVRESARRTANFLRAATICSYLGSTTVGSYKRGKTRYGPGTGLVLNLQPICKQDAVARAVVALTRNIQYNDRLDMPAGALTTGTCSGFSVTMLTDETAAQEHDDDLSVDCDPIPPPADYVPRPGDPANGALRLMEYTVDKVGNGHGGEPPLIGRWYEAPAAFGGMRGGFVQMWSAATGQWGTVCSDGWDDNDAQVACRALGFSYGKAGYEKYPPSGSSDNYFFRWKQMFMTQVACTGKERSILECPYSSNTDSCFYTDVARVKCSNEPLPADLQPTPTRTSCDKICIQLRLVVAEFAAEFKYPPGAPFNVMAGFGRFMTSMWSDIITGGGEGLGLDSTLYSPFVPIASDSNYVCGAASNVGAFFSSINKQDRDDGDEGMLAMDSDAYSAIQKYSDKSFSTFTGVVQNSQATPCAPAYDEVGDSWRIETPPTYAYVIKQTCSAASVKYMYKGSCTAGDISIPLLSPPPAADLSSARLLPPSPPPSPPSAAAINPFGCYNASTLPAAGITVAVYMNYTSSVANLTLANCAAAARSSSSNSNSSSNSSSSSPLRVPAYVALAVTNNDPLTSRYMCIGLQLPGDKVQLNATAAAAAARLPSLDACANGGRRSCTAGAGNLPQQQVPCNGGTKKALEVLAVYDLGALGKGF